MLNRLRNPPRLQKQLIHRGECGLRKHKKQIKEDVELEKNSYAT